MYEYYSSNSYLTESQMQINAKCIAKYFLSKGFSLNATCGMLGNMQSESSLNPGIWESLKKGNLSGGYGLVQWTPATNYITWANNHGYNIGDLYRQCEKIVDEMNKKEQWIATEKYPMSFKDFSVSTLSPDYLAMVFITNYERPYTTNQPWRGTQALNWYTFLSGQQLPPYFPDVPQSVQKKLLISSIINKRRFYRC